MLIFDELRRGGQGGKWNRAALVEGIRLHLVDYFVPGRQGDPPGRLSNAAGCRPSEAPLHVLGSPEQAALLWSLVLAAERLRRYFGSPSLALSPLFTLE